MKERFGLPGKVAVKTSKYYGMLIVSLFFVVITALPVYAAAGGNYFDFKVGGYFPQKNFLKQGNDGIGTELFFGHYFTKNIAGEVGAGYFQAKVPVYTSFGSKVKTTYRIYPVMFNLVVSAKTGSFEPFVKGGVGWYFADVDQTFDTISSSAFGYQFGAGALISNIGIEGDYISAKPTLLGSKTDISGYTATIFYRLRL